MAAPTKLSATERLAQLNREVEQASKEPAALKRRIAADQDKVRANGGVRYDYHYHADWPRFQELVAELGVIGEERDRHRRTTTIERVEEQVNSSKSLAQLHSALAELRGALAQLLADENTVIQLVAEGFSYPVNQAAHVVRSDPRVGQLDHLVRTLEQDGGIQAPRLDSHPHRYLAGELYVEVDHTITNEEHEP